MTPLLFFYLCTFKRLREAAEKAKIELLSKPQTDINLPFITADASGAKHLNITLTRSKFESLVNHLIERTKNPSKDCVKDARIKSKEVYNAILDFLVSEFQKTEGIDLSKDRLAFQRLKEAAEKAKIELSSTTQTDINLRFITADASGAKHLNITLTRSKFEALTNNLIERTKNPCKNCVNGAGITTKEVYNAILDFLVSEFKRTEGIDLSKDKLAFERLKEAAEKAKIELSSTTQTNINLPFITADAYGAKHLNITLTRSKFEALVNHLIERNKNPCKICVKDAGITTKEVDEVLVGGMTRVQRRNIIKARRGTHLP